LLLSSLATAAPRVAESVEEFNKEIERRQKVGAGKAADTTEALKTERIRLEKLEKLNREGSPTLTELELKELIKQVEERYKYTLFTRNIASCFCITKLKVWERHFLPPWRASCCRWISGKVPLPLTSFRLKGFI